MKSSGYNTSAAVKSSEYNTSAGSHLRWWPALKSTSTNPLFTIWVEVDTSRLHSLLQPWNLVVFIPWSTNQTDLLYKGRVATSHSAGWEEACYLEEQYSIRRRQAHSYERHLVHLASLLCLFTVFRSGWFIILTVFVKPSFGKAQKTYIEGFIW